MNKNGAMTQGCKQALAVFLNLALMINQMSAELQQITFDSAEWTPLQTVGSDPASGWQLFSGNALVSPNGEGFGGGRGLKIPANSQTETRISRAVTWDIAEKTAFIDFRIKPAANQENSLSTIVANGTQLAFQVPAGSNTGEVWVYHGNDGIDAEVQPEEWIRTAGTFSIPNGGTTSNSYLRLTLRHDYLRNLWDLFIDDKLAAANLSFEGKGTNLESLDFFGSEVGDILLDDIAALPVNMLFPDADKDGLSDAWELANGSNPNLYDREAIKPGTGRSFLDHYMDSLWPSVNGGGGPSVSSTVSIPALTLPAHQAVGALKGSLSVGGDGSANYSIPIDIPKGTAGMEPKLSLSYSSSAGSGVCGVGWSISGLQRITRGPSSVAKDGAYDPMDFDPSDRFFLNGERLICISGTYGAPDSEYRTEIDSFSRIMAKGTGPAYWTVETKAGLRLIFGDNASGSELNKGGAIAWCVNKVEDTLGNYYQIDYERGDNAGGNFDFSDHRVSHIGYTGVPGQLPYCHIDFEYEVGPEFRRAYTKQAAFLTTKRLKKIKVRTGTTANHTYVLDYQNSYQTGRSFLKKVTKLVPASPGAAPTVEVPGTEFNYDGITEGEPLWKDPGNTNLPVYGSGLDATSEVNSGVDVDEANTTIRLAGDVSRAFDLPGTGIALASDTRLRFDFRSTKQVNGALIGLDADTTYQSAASTILFRIGGTGTITMASGLNFAGTTLPYTGSDWKTFDVNIGSLGTGTRNNLILMCVDNEISDGVDTAFFRNVKFYRDSSQVPSDVDPISFNIDSEVPRYSDSSGRDLGVVAADLNSDGLPDLSDWRVFNYTLTGNDLEPEVDGNTYRNIGGEFVRDTSIRPLSNLPLSSRVTDTIAHEYNVKHHLTAMPVDVDGDGRTDLMSSHNINSSSGYIKNGYAFYSFVGGIWTEQVAWKLPFYIKNNTSSESRGGKRRDHHFQWMDLNNDGYQDVVVHTTDFGRLHDRITDAEILPGNASIAYLNKGKNGPGWTKDPYVYLPAPLMEDGKDVGRRIIDLDGDGVPELAQARYIVSQLLQRTHFLAPPTNAYRWYPSTATGQTVVNAYDIPTGLVLSSGNDRGVLLMDLNGDGMPDVLRSHKEITAGFVSKTWLNHGLGGAGGDPWIVEDETSGSMAQADTYDFPYPLHYESSAYDSNWRIGYGFQPADVNGDGLVDIVYADQETADTSGSDNVTFLNTGNGWKKRTEWLLPGTHRIYRNNDERFDGKRWSKLEDLNGDGFPDLITGLIGNTPKVWFNNCRPEVLTSVTDGFGSELTVDYHRLNDPTPTPGFGTRVYEKETGTLPAGHAVIIDSRLVVSRYSEPNGTGGSRSRSQRYGDLRYDRNNDASLGFGWMEAKDELTGQITRTDFGYYENLSNPTTIRRDIYPFGGSPALVRTWVDVKDPALVKPEVLAGKKLLSKEVHWYGGLATTSGTGGVIRRPVEIKAMKSSYDLKGTLIGQTTTTQNVADFDSYGFVKKSTVASLDGTSVVTVSNFSQTVSTTDWILGRLTSSTVTKTRGAETISRSSSFTYDSNGLLKTETVQPGHALSSTKTYTRDGFGNITRTTLSAAGQVSRYSDTGYDPNGRFVVSEKNQLQHQVTFSYDPVRALLLSKTDENNHLTTIFGYDQFGTLTHTRHPDGTETGEVTGFASNGDLPSDVAFLVPVSLKYFRAQQSSGSPVVKVYIDALGRETVSETTVLRNALSGSTSKLYTITQYDSLGRKVFVSEPFASGEDPQYTFIDYDLLGRVVQTTQPDSQFPSSRNDYLIATDTLTLDGQPTTYTKAQNSKSGLLERWEDQHGRLVKSVDPSDQVTTFKHDLDGRILEVRMNDVLMLSNTFDVFGNKTSVTEKNSGTSSSTYNAFGEVVTTTSPVKDVEGFNKVTSYTYDVLGRPSTVTRPGLEGTFTTLYDSGGCTGKAWKTTNGLNGNEEISSITLFDSYGRPRFSSNSREGKLAVTFTTYDALGRVDSTTDAGGLSLIHKYDAGTSQPVSITIGTGSPGAGTVVWQAGEFDSKGRAKSQSLANGVSTSATYFDGTGQLKTLSASAGSTSLQNKGYTWDNLGNLGTRNDLLKNRLETFTHDGMNRLTSTTVSGAGAPPAASYVYAANGNLVSKPGASLTYNSSLAPHAVVSATIKGAARTYAYDAAGYVTSDSKRNYTWTSFGQLSSLDYEGAPALQDFSGTTIYSASRVQTDFEFDAGGNRAYQIKKRIALDGSRQLEETFYLGSYEKEIHSTQPLGSEPNLTKTVHRHSIGGFAVYTRTEKPGLPDAVKLSTILKDHLGSTDVIFTGTWNGSSFASHETEFQSFDPWGERRNPQTYHSYRASDTDAFRTSAQDYDRGYTGHEQLDDSGLIHMNGRIYDPELGRMLSPDPFVQIPEYSQNFNRYSYVMNNPLNLTDPSGFSWVSKAFDSMGNWLQENWVQIVVIVVVAIVTWGVGAAFTTAATNASTSSAFATFTAGTASAAGSATLTATGMAVTGGVAGTVGGGLSAGLAGGDLGDVLRGAAVGGIQGAISGGVLHGLADGLRFDSALLHVAGHGVVGGAANEAMGGKFQDGFLSGAASAGAGHLGLFDGIDGPDIVSRAARTTMAGVVGGTASALGGGKFANGAWTGAFQHYLNLEFGVDLDPNSPYFLEQGFGMNPGQRTDPFTEVLVGGVGTGGAKLSMFAARQGTGLLARVFGIGGAKVVAAAKSGSRAPFNLWASKTKGIMGEISDDGIVTFAVEAGAGSPMRGVEMFAQMMKHFGSNVKGIRGSWHYGDNLAAVNKLTSEGMSLSKAALQTWTARRAAENGFKSVRVLSSEGTAGAYKSVNVLFE